MSSFTLITLNREDDGGIEKYLGKIYRMKEILLLDLFLNGLYILTSSFCRGYVQNIARWEEMALSSYVGWTTTHNHLFGLS